MVEYNNILDDELNILSQVVEKYKNSYYELVDKFGEKIAREEYSKGGRLLLRGYYCPSPTYDLLMGNITRGSLNKRNSTKYDYRYRFDADKNLCVVERFGRDSEGRGIQGREFVIQALSENISIGFATIESKLYKPEISYATHCCYNNNGQITRYSFALARVVENKIHFDDLRVEEYHYQNMSIVGVTIYSGLKPNTCLVGVYDFEYNNTGCIKAYNVHEFRNLVAPTGITGKRRFVVEPATCLTRWDYSRGRC